MPNLDNNVKFNNLGGEIDMHNASVSYLIESYMEPFDTAYGFQHPGLPEQLELLKLSWTVESGIFSTTIPSVYQDVSDYQALSLWVAMDPANQLNYNQPTQSLMLSLRDSRGYIEHIILDSSALNKPDGQLSSSNYQSQWSTFTPLSNIRIPLEYFSKVDLSEITEIIIRFNQTSSGSILMGDLRFIY